MVQIKVIDSGIGIKEEDQNKLFKLFGFLDSSKEINTKGVGLGLHISQKLVKQFGGKIILESEFGLGSTFICLFDLENQAEGESSLKRHLNPTQRKYQKIVVKRKNNGQIFQEEVAEERKAQKVNFISKEIPNKV